MPDVLIFDDDPTIGDLAKELLGEKGVSVEHFLSGAGVIELIQREKPRLVVLDIMMKGLDGLSACRAVRANPTTKHVKIVVVTAKNFRADQQRAKLYGADLFIGKPFEPAQFARAIVDLMGLPAGRAEARSAPAGPVIVTLLAGAAAVQGEGLWVIFDAGRGLGDWLKGQTAIPKVCWVYLSRYHDDAVRELSAASALLAAGCQVKLAGPDSPENHLQRLGPRLAATTASGDRALPFLYPQREGDFQLAPGVLGQAQYALHPELTIAYRVDLQGRRIVYCPAHEVDPSPHGWRGHEMNKFRAFFRDADLLIHGWRRSLADPAVDDGLGKGAWEPVVDLAAESRVKRLALVALPGATAVPDLQARLARRIAEKKLHLQAAAVAPPQSAIL